MRLDRREVLRAGGLSVATAGAAVWLAGRSHKPDPPRVQVVRRNLTVPAGGGRPPLAIAEGAADPRAAVRQAVAELGGMGRFIGRGDVVALKPNMAWDRTPEQAANTNPEIVAEVVRLCLDAGARRVVVTDMSVNEPRRVFERSGIAAAAQAAGAEVLLPEARLFREVDLRGEVLGAWPILQPFLEADKVINLPIAKQHSLTGATLGMKNWYGILGGQRQRLHQRIHESLADLAAFLRPTLTILDAWRVLVRNGPGGGSLADVLLKRTVAAGTDPVAVDAWAGKAFWGFDEGVLVYLRLARERGV
jgi:uncharacterized protein (DUF362 family)